MEINKKELLEKAFGDERFIKNRFAQYLEDTLNPILSKLVYYPINLKYVVDHGGDAKTDPDIVCDPQTAEEIRSHLKAILEKYRPPVFAPLR